MNAQTKLSAEVVEMKRKILRLLCETGLHVSFIELDNGIEGFHGDYDYVASGKFENIVFWLSMSKEAVLALNQLQKEGLMKFNPSSFRTYLLDGGTIRLPIAKRPRRYSTPHWFPMSINITPKGERMTKTNSSAGLREGNIS